MQAACSASTAQERWRGVMHGGPARVGGWRRCRDRRTSAGTDSDPGGMADDGSVTPMPPPSEGEAVTVDLPQFAALMEEVCQATISRPPRPSPARARMCPQCTSMCNVVLSEIRFESPCAVSTAAASSVRVHCG